MRGLDLESTRTLLDKLQCELRGLSNRTASLVDESPPAIGDELGYLSTDIAHLAAIVRCCSTGGTPFCTAFSPNKRKPKPMTNDLVNSK